MAGSLGYADRLKPKRKLGGQLGWPEWFEDVEAVRTKVDNLADLIKTCKKVFLFTGAGISTAVGVPDFRGPNGIWTLRDKGLPITAPLTPFEFAHPSLTHMAISALVAHGLGTYVCSQNVDSLHLRSGVPRSKLAELHGNCFAERCSACKREYVRDFQVETVDFKPTGRLCMAPGCGKPLVDNVLDWDSALPDDELDASIEAAEQAGVCMVLGSSLQIVPANEIPLFTVDAGGHLAIVNLQKTPRDRRAGTILRVRVDQAMARLMYSLSIPIPPYVRLDGVVVAASARGTFDQSLTKVEHVKQEGSAADSWEVQVVVHSVHGLACPLPMIAALRLLVGLDSSSNRGNSVNTGTPSNDREGVHVQLEHVGAWSGVQMQGSSGGEATGGVAGGAAGLSSVPGAGAKAEPVHCTWHKQGDAAPVASNSLCARWLAEAEAVSPCSSGVPIAGPYVFKVSGIPASWLSVACKVELQLTQFASPGQQYVSLPEVIVELNSRTAGQQDTKQQGAVGGRGARASSSLAAGEGSWQQWLRPDHDQSVSGVLSSTQLLLPGQAPAEMLARMEAAAAHTASAGRGSTSGSDAAQQQGLLELGAQPEVLASGPGFTLFTYVSQVVRYDAEAVWAAYESNPPPVHMPQPRKKPKGPPPAPKPTRSQMYEEAARASGVDLRRSGRARQPSAKAAGRTGGAAGLVGSRRARGSGSGSESGSESGSAGTGEGGGEGSEEEGEEDA